MNPELKIIILHRRLSCKDEDASDQELSEKIIYFYPESDSFEKKVRLIPSSFSVSAYTVLTANDNPRIGKSNRLLNPILR